MDSLEARLYRADGGEGLEDPVTDLVFFNWLVRRYYPERLDELRGNADELYIQRLVIEADERPMIEYHTMTYNE